LTRVCAVGGVVGAGVSMRTSGIRSELFSELLQLPSDEAPHAAQARHMYVIKRGGRFACDAIDRDG